MNWVFRGTLRVLSRAKGVYPRLFAWIAPYVVFMYLRVARRTRSSSAVPIHGRPAVWTDRESHVKPVIVMPAFTHAYVRNLRRSLKGAVHVLMYPQVHQWGPRPRFQSVDIFHLHFIDTLGLDLEGTKSLIANLRATRTKIVWTAHDLTPHAKNAEYYEPIFQCWANAADGVIHHSRCGERALRERYSFHSSSVHVVIGNRYRSEHTDLLRLHRRPAIEAKLGLKPAKVRIGLVGSPRAEKKVTEFLEGVALSSVEGIEVVCWSLRPRETAPDDQRIAIAEPYGYVSERRYRERLAVCDLIALPFDPDGEMLTSGLVVGSVGMGLGILGSEWEYIAEVAGDAMIPCGHTRETVAACLNRLRPEDVVAARSASLRLHELLGWDSAREPLLDFYRTVLQIR